MTPPTHVFPKIIGSGLSWLTEYSGQNKRLPLEMTLCPISTFSNNWNRNTVPDGSLPARCGRRCLPLRPAAPGPAQPLLVPWRAEIKPRYWSRSRLGGVNWNLLQKADLDSWESGCLNLHFPFCKQYRSWRIYLCRGPQPPPPSISNDIPFPCQHRRGSAVLQWPHHTSPLTSPRGFLMASSPILVPALFTVPD